MLCRLHQCPETDNVHKKSLPLSDQSEAMTVIRRRMLTQDDNNDLLSVRSEAVQCNAVLLKNIPPLCPTTRLVPNAHFRTAASYSS